MKDSFRIPDCSLVYQAGLSAIQQAAKNIVTNYYGNTYLSVDSQAAMLSLRSGRIKSKVVLGPILALENMDRLYQFVWVKSHYGVLDN